MSHLGILRALDYLFYKFSKWLCRELSWTCASRYYFIHLIQFIRDYTTQFANWLTLLYLDFRSEGRITNAGRCTNGFFYLKIVCALNTAKKNTVIIPISVILSGELATCHVCNTNWTMCLMSSLDMPLTTPSVFFKDLGAWISEGLST